ARAKRRSAEGLPEGAEEAAEGRQAGLALGRRGRALEQIEADALADAARRHRERDLQQNLDPGEDDRPGRKGAGAMDLDPGVLRARGDGKRGELLASLLERRPVE